MSRAVLLLACSTTLMSCVIAREPDYEPPPNYPASVVGTTETPTDVVYTHTIGGTVGADAGAGAMELTLDAIVRDPNFGDTLQGLVFVNRHNASSRGDALLRSFTIPSSGSFERNVQLTIPDGELTRGECNVVELHVSGGFSGFPELLPQGEAVDGVTDLGVGVWYVSVPTEETPQPTLDTCPGPEVTP